MRVIHRSEARAQAVDTSASFPRGPRRPPLDGGATFAERGGRASGLLALLFLAVATVASGDGIRSIVASVQNPESRLGEVIVYILQIEGDEELSSIVPESVDFGGLVPAGPPRSEYRTGVNIVNGQVYNNFEKVFVYELTAPAEGEYEIGPATVRLRSRPWTSQPVRVRVAPTNTAALPPSLQGEPILHATSGQPAIDRQIEGLVFLRPSISRPDPYVGERVTVSYHLYYDPRIQPVNKTIYGKPSAQGPLWEESYPAQIANPSQPVTTEVIDGRQYNRELVYQARVTPTKPGDFKIAGMLLRFRLPVRQQGRRRDVFDDLFSDPFGNFVTVDARGGPLEMKVAPIPDQASHPEFSGTVGTYSIRGELDRRTLPANEFATLTVTLEGEGAISLASEPKFPDSPDFSLFDHVKKVVEGPVAAGLPAGGRMTIEFVLRPKRAGKVRTPTIAYTIFDPAARDYRRLEVPPMEVEVTPVAGANVAGGEGAASAGASPATSGDGALPRDLESGLRFLDPVVELSRRAPLPLHDSPVWWLLQLAALGGAGAAFLVSARRDAVDPASLRRERAAGELDRRLAAARDLLANGVREAAVEALERALREFCGARFGASPDGMTAEAVHAKALANGAPESVATSLSSLVDRCATIRYAPGGAESADVAGWIEEAAAAARAVAGRPPEPAP